MKTAPRKLSRSRLVPFEEEPNPQAQERPLEKPYSKAPEGVPTTSEPKPVALKSAPNVQNQTKRTVAKVTLKPVVQKRTAPKSASPSVAVSKGPTWEETVTRLATEIVGGVKSEFTYIRTGVQDTGDAAKLKSFVTAIDPFGLLKAPQATTDSAKAKYKALDADQWGAFLEAVSITGSMPDGSRGARPAWDEIALDRAVGARAATTSGVPRLQHSIWVGGPLSDAVPKQKAFMDRLVKNANDNPGWKVCLWTDQSRADMLVAKADSPLGKFRDWAAANNINLIPVDEVFAGDNAMQLQAMFRLEQFKGGTGRAAASDLLRLEIVNRFGGVYCDGDKPINKPLDDIATYTAGHGGFTTAQEKGQFQNCGMCGIPGNGIVTEVLKAIQTNYGKPRDSLVPKERQNRPTRFEVIMRTGPSIVRDVALKAEGKSLDKQQDSQHLMPVDFITPPAVYTTSWDPSLIPCWGDRDLSAYVRNNERVESAANAQNRVAAAVAQLRRRMQAPHAQVVLTPEAAAAQKAAVQKAVTSLVYGVWNNDGLFNMDLAEQHLKSAPDRDLARDMVLKAFADPAMANVVQQVKTLQLPGNAPTKDARPSPIPLPESTLDTIFLGKLFPNLRMQDCTLQHAAYQGNVQFIDYAREHGLLDLNAVSTRALEVGQRLQGDRAYAADPFNVLMAAVRGGQRDVLALLSQNPEFGGLLDTGAQVGQLDTTLWALRALPTNDRNNVNTAKLLGTLLSLKRPSVSSSGAAITVELSDDECLYLFDQFYQSVQTETGKPPVMSTPAYANAYQEAITAGRPKLAARMEARGASLAKLLPQDFQNLRNSLASSAADLGGNRIAYLRLALKAGLVPDLINGAANRQLPNLQTIKNDYTTVPADPNNAQQITDYLAKALAYAQSHIDDKNSGRGSRVDGWRNGVKSVLNLLGNTGASQRTGEQSALLEAATLVTGKLQQMKRGK